MSKPKLDDHATRASSEQQRYKNYYSLDFYKQTGKLQSGSFKATSMDEFKEPRVDASCSGDARRSIGSLQAPLKCQASPYFSNVAQRPPSVKRPMTTDKKQEVDATKCSHKNNGAVRGYAANTNKGLIRNYNEDRVAIILNIMKPLNRVKEQWPKCSYFGVYDGHGGVSCAEFLRDNLHQYVIREPAFPSNPREALRQGFLKAESKFLEQAQKQQEIDRSGSCALVTLIVGDQCFVANVGDSRAVMSGNGGQKVYTLSRDHKPSDEEEMQRIREAGGKIYQSKVPTQGENGQQLTILGPHRVLPGRLSVSRTFGDIEAKLSQFGGNGKVVICDPEIRQFPISEEHDFIVMGSDGIFDKLTSKDCINQSWDCVDRHPLEDIHPVCGRMVESVMNESMKRKSCDNVTVVVIGLTGLLKSLTTENKENRQQSKLQDTGSKPKSGPTKQVSKNASLQTLTQVKQPCNPISPSQRHFETYLSSFKEKPVA